ncbi:MAG TPA: hypothetical protein ENN85_06460 [Methanoculleus sp.]|nr:hypothetical protein [Methanoculleus sp.]
MGVHHRGMGVFVEVFGSRHDLKPMFMGVMGFIVPVAVGMGEGEVAMRGQCPSPMRSRARGSSGAGRRRTACLVLP